MISFYIHDSRIANNDASTNRSAFSCNLLKANGEEDKNFRKIRARAESLPNVPPLEKPLKFQSERSLLPTNYYLRLNCFIL
jgi:hypothetical protein